MSNEMQQTGATTQMIETVESNLTVSSVARAVSRNETGKLTNDLFRSVIRGSCKFSAFFGIVMRPNKCDKVHRADSCP